MYCRNTHAFYFQIVKLQCAGVHAALVYTRVDNLRFRFLLKHTLEIEFGPGQFS